MRTVDPRRRLLGVLVAGTAMLVTAAPAPVSADGVDSTEVIGGPQLASTGLVVNTPPGERPPPVVDAASYVLADLATGEVLAAKNPHGRFAPASTLKILTAVTFIPRLDPDRKVKAEFEDVAVDGTKVGVVPGMRYTVRELMTAMLIMSGNDAALTLATADGDERDALREMNAEALRLRAEDTVARTTNGLDAKGQVSSAYDLALLARAGLVMPDFRTYVSTRRSHFSAPKGKRYEIYTHDHLLLNYRGAFGVKNGYTAAARASFVGAAERKGRQLVVALMRGRPDLWREAARLLTWGFKSPGSLVPVGTLVDPLPDDVDATAVDAGATGSGTTATTLAEPTPSEGWGLPTAPLAAAGGVVLVFTALRVRARRRYRRRRSRSKLSLPPI